MIEDFVNQPSAEFMVPRRWEMDSILVWELQNWVVSIALQIFFPSVNQVMWDLLCLKNKNVIVHDIWTAPFKSLKYVGFEYKILLYWKKEHRKASSLCCTAFSRFNSFYRTFVKCLSVWKRVILLMFVSCFKLLKTGLY